MGSSFNCLECGAAVHGDGPHHERGFCSENCSENWNEWRFHEEVRDIPGFSHVFTDEEYPTLEWVLQYCMIVLGCLVNISVELPGTFTVEAMYEWCSPAYRFFLGNFAEAFTGIDGFALDARQKFFIDTGDEENIGFRYTEVQKTGNDLTRVCLDLTMEVLATKRRFGWECDKWAKSHAAELREAARRYVISTQMWTLDGEPIAHVWGEFITWLDSLGGEEKSWA